MHGAPHEVLLVVDGNTGQNALAQVQGLRRRAAADRAGGDQARRHRQGRRAGRDRRAGCSEAGRSVPVYFIGIGEQLEDLQTFDAREFARGPARLNAAALRCQRLGGCRVRRRRPKPPVPCRRRSRTGRRSARYWSISAISGTGISGIGRECLSAAARCPPRRRRSRVRTSTGRWQIAFAPDMHADAGRLSTRAMRSWRRRLRGDLFGRADVHHRQHARADVADQQVGAELADALQPVGCRNGASARARSATAAPGPAP